MTVRIHPHARQRMAERGASEAEVIETITSGSQFDAKFGRVGFRKEFLAQGLWRGRPYSAKQWDVIAVDDDCWLVITVIIKHFLVPESKS